MDMNGFKRDLKGIFVQKWLKSEVLVVFFAAPVLAIIALLYYELANDKPIRFILEVILTLVVVVAFQVTIAWIDYRRISRYLVPDNRQKIGAAMVHMSKSPFVDTWTMFIRWFVIAQLIVTVPGYLRYHNLNETISLMILMLFTGIISSAMTFMISSTAMMKAYNHLIFASYVEEKQQISGMKLSSKIRWTAIIIAAYSVSMFSSLIYFAISQGVTVDHFILGFIIIGVFSLLMSIILTQLLATGVNTVVVTVGMVADEVAKGDYTVRKDYYSKDELGDILFGLAKVVMASEEMIGEVKQSSIVLAGVAKQLAENSDETSKSAIEIADTISDIANGAASQAEDTSNGVMKIEVFNKLLVQNNDHIEHLNTIVEEVDKLKDDGLDVLIGLKETTEVSNQANEAISKILGRTETDVAKIQSASDMIRSISEQTNLLALNASIEAARAGEAGKGFAVVADEIRKLAEQSNSFTSEIEHIIEDLTEGTNQAIKALEQVGAASREQNQSVSMTDEKFQGITIAIKKLESALNEILESERLMNNQSSDITGIFENLSAISEENSASTEEIAATVEEQTASVEEVANASRNLNDMAENILRFIERFKVDD